MIERVDVCSNTEQDHHQMRRCGESLKPVPFKKPLPGCRLDPRRVRTRLAKSPIQADQSLDEAHGGH